MIGNIEYYFKTVKDDQFLPCDHARKGCWIHVSNANEQRIKELSEIVGVDVSDLMDTLDRYELPRIEQEERELIVYTRHPSTHELGSYTATLTFLLTPDYFITISPENPQFIRKYIKQKTIVSSSQKTKLFTQLLRRMTYLFTTEIKKTRSIVMRREKELAKVESEDIITITKEEEKLNQYFSALHSLGIVLNQFKDGKKLSNLYEKDQDLIEDLYYAAQQSKENCSINLKSIRALRDAYQIIFTNNLNKTIKLLTALTIILSIPTMISSVYGMNVQLPLEKNIFAFEYLILITFVILTISLHIFKRKRWL